MSGASYNGYDWKTREGIMRAYKRGEAGEGFTFAGKPCGLCGDPDRPAGEWHSEDYSTPYSFIPPESYPMCSACHGRLHKRFNKRPEEWELFCQHVEAGGYGREFTRNYPPRRRFLAMDAIAAGETLEVATIREVAFSNDRWWRNLTIDPESLDAPWARPRTLRPRPNSDAFRVGVGEIGLSAKEVELLKVHANSKRRTATMRDLANEVLGQDKPGSINLIYGRLARRLAERLNWQPDLRNDGSPIWMSMVAEGWKPPRREFEWTMVPSLAKLWRQ